MKGFILSLLTKFVPNLIPGLGALANPWIWVFALSGAVSCFLYGVYLEHGRFETHLKQDELVQQAYNFWATQRNAGQQRINQETVNDLKTRNQKLAVDNATLLSSLSNLAKTSSLPPESPPGGRDQPGKICFSRAGLDAGDQAIRAARAEFLAKIAARYGRASNIVQSCLEWDTKQRQLEVDTPEPK